MDHSLFERLCKTASDTEELGSCLAKLIIENVDMPRFIALCGGLGAGKTAFVRGFCSVACPAAAVRSPSFALVNEYHGQTNVFHFDVWRITDEDDLYSTGFYDYLERNGIILCEWADNIDYALPQTYIKVQINGSGDDPRRITIKLNKNGEV